LVNQVTTAFADNSEQKSFAAPGGLSVRRGITPERSTFFEGDTMSRLARSLRAGIGALALALVALTALATGAYADGSPIVGQVFVNDNSTGANTVAAFERHEDGSITPSPGSPFVTGGVGSGKGLGSQGALQEARSGRELIVADAGSNQLSVLRLRKGALQPVGPPVSSGGVDPVSIAVSGNLVYVANAGEGGTNVTGFFLTPAGLAPLPNSTVTLPSGSGPADVLFNSNGSKLVVTLVNTSQIASYDVRSGRLFAAPGSPYAGQGLGQIGAQFRPTSNDQLFVSNAHNGAGLGTVSAFEVNKFAELTSITGPPVADLETAPCWVEISHDGNYLFTTNTASGSISSYAIAPNGALTLLGSVAAGEAGIGDVDLRLTPDGKFLYVNGSKANVVAAFAVNGGELTQLPSSPTPLPAGSVASGIVVQ
jgi:6-phosphogluconolactonase (cycloisomerase 2 family)